MSRSRELSLIICLIVLLFSFGCSDPARPGKKQGKPIETSLLCGCKPTHITKDDWRIEFKNGSLPAENPSSISIAAILAWPQGLEPGPRTPRSGRELALFRVPKAYLQSMFLRKSDCDLHMEVSDLPDKDAPRMIIETPGTTEYCEARTNLYSDLQQRGIKVTDLNQELSQPLPAEIVGTAFRDQSHPIWFSRGSDKVTTLWELHPAIVNLLPQVP